MTSISLVTLTDFKEFKTELKNELIDALRILLNDKNTLHELEYLKSKEVRSILKCSPSTLQYLRESGKLIYKKVGSTYYYKKVDVRNLIETNT